MFFVTIIILFLNTISNIKCNIKCLIFVLISKIVFENSIIIVTKTHQKNSIILSFFKSKEEKEEF